MIETWSPGFVQGQIIAACPGVVGVLYTTFQLFSCELARHMPSKSIFLTLTNGRKDVKLLRITPVNFS